MDLRLSRRFGRLGAGQLGTASFAAESEAIFAAFSTPPSEARKALIGATVDRLMRAGVWAKLDFLHIFAAAAAQAAKINWIDPGTFDATESGDVVFTADRGYGSDAPGGAVNVPFNPTTAPGANFVQNSASVGAWCREVGQVEPRLVADSGETASYIYSRYTDDLVYARINAAADIEAESLDGSGLWLVTRLDGAVQRVDRNGALYASAEIASVLVVSETFSMAPRASLGQHAAVFAGAGLTTAESAALYGALLHYMQTVGASAL